MKIYTKRGDAGQTSLFDGASVSKACLRVAAYGDVDELNACLGVAREELRGDQRLADIDAALESLQRDLFALGAVLADPRRDAGRPVTQWGKQVAFDEGMAGPLERQIDAWEAQLQPLTSFILPGGSRAAAALHVARTVARRAERSVVALHEQGAGMPAGVVYLNRVSDLLFVASRLANARVGAPDVPWQASAPAPP